MLQIRHRYLSVLFLGVAVGSLCGLVDTSLNASAAPVSGTHHAHGVVRKVTQRVMSGLLVVDLQGSYSGNCCLAVYDDSPEIGIGDRIDFVAEFRPLSVPRDVDGDIDLSHYYYLNHIGSRAVAVRDSIMVTGTDDSFFMRLHRYRERLVDHITCSGLSDASQSFLAALILGDDSLLDSEVRPQFAATGLAHVLALSGMHVAVIVAMLSVVLFPLSFLGLRRVRWIAVIVLLWIYAIVTGLPPTVLRAVIMFTMVLTAKCIYRFNVSANALCFSAIIILVFMPRQLFAPGFQLSFMAVFAMAVIPATLPKMVIDSRLLRWIYDYIVFTVSASLGTMLLAAYYFHQVPLAFLFTNLPVSVLLPFILTGGIVILLLSLCGLSWGFFDGIVDFICRVVFGFIDWVSGLPGVSVTDLWLPAWSVWAGYAAIAVLVAALCYRRYTLAVSGVSLAVMTVSLVSLSVGVADDDVLFVGRNGGATNIIYTHGCRAYMVTSAPAVFCRREAERSMIRYSDFMMEHGVDSIHSLNGSSPCMNTLVTFASKRIAMINSDILPANTDSVDYMIVCRGFHGDILDLIDVMACDTVLLGTDLNGIRRRRYLEELHDYSIPCRSLSGDYGLVLRNRR